MVQPLSLRIRSVLDRPTSGLLTVPTTGHTGPGTTQPHKTRGRMAHNLINTQMSVLQETGVMSDHITVRAMESKWVMRSSTATATCYLEFFRNAFVI